MSRTITIDELRVRLTTEEDPQVRKILKDTIVYLLDPDPLTVTDEHDVDGLRPNRNPEDLRNEHPKLSFRSLGHRVAGLHRRLVGTDLVIHRTPRTRGRRGISR